MFDKTIDNRPIILRQYYFSYNDYMIVAYYNYDNIILILQILDLQLYIIIKVVMIIACYPRYKYDIIIIMVLLLM